MPGTPVPTGPAPLVSVGMLAYNDRAYVATAITDLLRQSFVDFELIISDDGSADGTDTICAHYAAADARIRFYRQPVRLGMQKNYEFVRDQARGRFFMWAASDDRWEPHYLAVLVDALSQRADLASAFTPYSFIDEQGQPCTGALGQVHVEHYEGRSALARLVRFCWQYDDAFFYGLHRRESVTAARFPVWWGANARTPRNNNFPVLVYLLMRGGYLSLGEEPRFFKRMHLQSAPRYPQGSGAQPGRDHLAFLLRKINVLYVSLVAVQRASGSPVMTALAVLPLGSRCLYDCGLQTVALSR